MASKAQRGWKLFHSLRVASVLVGGAFIAVSGCSSGGSSTFGVDDNPEISVLVDGQKLSDNTCAHFGTDDTNGVIKQSKKLTITNTGALGTLCIDKITFTSSETKPITVQTLNAVITSPVAACKPSYFTLAPYKTKLVVKAKSSGTVTLPVTMAKTAPQACASRTLTLTFVSTATY